MTAFVFSSLLPCGQCGQCGPWLKELMIINRENDEKHEQLIKKIFFTAKEEIGFTFIIFSHSRFVTGSFRHSYMECIEYVNALELLFYLEFIFLILVIQKIL
jgi:hypothetical protein